MPKKIKTTPVTNSPDLTSSPPPAPNSPVSLANAPEVEVVEVVEQVIITPPVKKPRKQANPKPKKSILLETQLPEIAPLNLLPLFEEQIVQTDVAQQNTISVEGQVQVQDEDVQMEDEQSFASEVEQLTNEDQKKLAYDARATLKRDILDQARKIVHSHLDDFPENLKKNVSDIVLRLYDDPASLFSAIKHSNKGMLKMKFKNLPRPSLLQEPSVKAKKLEGFKQFLQTRISRQ